MKKMKAVGDVKLRSVYGRDGKNITMLEWVKEMQKGRHVAKDVMWGGLVLVSTVYLGIDHSFGIGKRPIIYESMAFVGDYSGVDCERYATEAEALEGHKKMVLRFRDPITVGRAVCGMLREKIELWFLSITAKVKRLQSVFNRNK